MPCRTLLLFIPESRLKHGARRTPLGGDDDHPLIHVRAMTTTVRAVGVEFRASRRELYKLKMQKISSSRTRFDNLRRALSVSRRREEVRIHGAFLPMSDSPNCEDPMNAFN